MKTKILTTAAILAALTFSSCNSDDDSGTTIPPVVVPPVEVLSGDITANRTLTKGTYSLSGILKVKPGVTLTIEPGTIITAKVDDSTLDYILIEKGADIIANGTATEPIILTASDKTRGKWGGLIIIGDAPIVSTGGATSATGEFGTSDTYGGSNAADSSGSLKYVQLLYAGATIPGSTTGEFNGFSLYAVGSGTVLENLVAAHGADDGFEFYGGSVSGKNLIAYSNGDDSFDWQDGWRGQLNENWFAYQRLTANYGIEAESKGVNNAFFPKVNGITLVRAANTLTETQSDVQYDAIQFKAQGNGDFNNIRVVGYTVTNSTLNAASVRIQDANTRDNQLATGKILIKNINSTTATLVAGTSGAPLGTVDPVAAGYFTTSTTAVGATLTAGAWSTVEGVDLVALLP